MGQTTKTFCTQKAHPIKGKAFMMKQTLGDYTYPDVVSDIKGAYFGPIKQTKGVTMAERKKEKIRRMFKDFLTQYQSHSLPNLEYDSP